MELVLEETEKETESNPVVEKGLKGQFTPVPDLGTVVKLLQMRGLATACLPAKGLRRPGFPPLFLHPVWGPPSG